MLVFLFLLLHITGDPVMVMAPEDATEEDIKKISPELEAYAELESMMTQRFNASITEEENLAEEWSAAVRAFKAQ